jgi:hypothetical protein
VLGCEFRFLDFGSRVSNTGKWFEAYGLGFGL